MRGTKKRPGDVRLSGDSGAHGWAPAENREVWSDATCVCPVLPAYVLAAAATRGAAAAMARKLSEYRNDNPRSLSSLSFCRWRLGTEGYARTEGYATWTNHTLLVGFALKRAAADGLKDDAAKKREFG